MKNNKKILAFDFVRTICAIGIIINHYCIESQDSVLQRFFVTFGSGEGSVGYTLVTVFLIISGALLYYNHPSIDSTRNFYISRFKTIFPSYYITWLIAAAGAIVFNRTFFKNPIYTFPLTIIGMDGYLAGLFPTWRLIGEWFIGAIVIVYLLYPLILSAINKKCIEFSLIISLLFLITDNWSMLGQNPYRNIFSLLLSFVLGILIIKYKDIQVDRGGYIGGTISFILMYFIPTGLNINLSSHIAGFCFFCMLFGIGRKIMTHTFVSNVIHKISSVSYEMFLIQRIVIVYTLRFLHPHDFIIHIAIIPIVILITFVGAFVIKLIRNKIMSYMFLKVLNN